MNIKIKSVAVLVSALILTGVLAGCGTESEVTGSDEKKDAPYHLKVGYSPSLCQAALFVAYENGYFKEEGLDAELIQIDAAHASDVIAANQVDVLQGLAAKMIQPIENGLPVKVTAGIHTGCIRLLVPENSPIQSLKDLKGKKIGVPGLADSGTIIAKRALYLDGVGVTDKNLEVEFSVFSRNDLPQALQKGAVDAISLTDPVGAIAAQEYGLRTLVDTAQTPPFDQEYCCVSMVTNKLAKEHPDVAEKATRAILKGAAWVQAHPQEAAKLELDKKYVAGNLELNTALLKSYHFIPSVQGGYNAIKDCTEQLAKIGLIAPDTDARKFTDAAFLFFKGLEDTPQTAQIEGSSGAGAGANDVPVKKMGYMSGSLSDENRDSSAKAENIPDCCAQET